MKASIENHDRIVQLLIAAGAKLDLLHQVQHILYMDLVKNYGIKFFRTCMEGGGGWGWC